MFEQYSQKVMEHFRNPRNVGEIENPDGVGHVGNPICILGSTLISTNSELKLISSIKVGDKVLSHDGNYHQVDRIYKRLYRGRVCSLKVQSLGRIVTTPEHHILALKMGHLDRRYSKFRQFKPDWHCAEELEEGDVILYPIPKESIDVFSMKFDIPILKWDFRSKNLPEEINLSDDFLRLIGYYLAEGYTRTDKCKGTVGFVFGASERRYVEEVVKIMENTFDVTLAATRETMNSINLMFYSARLARFFCKYFGKGAQDKRLPQVMMTLPPERQRHIIAGLWRGDGCILKNGAKFCTISRELAHQLKCLLMRQQIVFSFLTVPKKGIHKENYHLYVRSVPSLRKLSKIVGFESGWPEKKKRSLKAWYDDQFFYTRVSSKETKSYTGDVFNLKVRDTYSYVSDAVCLHNCGDIMELYIKVKDGVIVDAKFKTFGCLPPAEEVVLNSGGWQKISSINKGDRVLNSCGSKTYVAETYVREYDGPMLKIVPFVSPHNSFSLTPEHPVLCVKRSQLRRTRRSSYLCSWLRVDEDELLSTEPDYVKARDLERGDYLIFAADQGVRDNSQFSKEIMKLIGYYLSEGYTSANGSVIAFAFNKNEKGTIREVKSLLTKMAGKIAKERTRGNVTEVYVCSRRLVRFFHSICGRLARNKSLSKDVLLLPFEKQWEMIQTYLAGDGDSYKRLPKDSRTYRIITTSKSLAVQMQEVFARGGVFASIRKIYKRRCVIEGRRIRGSTMYLISFKLDRKHKFVHTNGKYFLVPIRKVEKKHFRGPVYNFQVGTEPNSYLVRGFAVHNCGAAIATSSMVTELVKGKTVEEALKISNRAVAEALGGLPPIKMHCSLLAEEALKSAIDDYLTKSKGKKPE